MKTCVAGGSPSEQEAENEGNVTKDQVGINFRGLHIVAQFL